MKVIITRHAQTSENVSGVNSGQESEILLNDTGKEQARRLGERLKSENITFAYVSPQKRAIDTAQAILQHHPLAKVVNVDQLKEQHLGVFEGKSRTEWKEFKKTASGRFDTIKPEGGESYAELQNRARSFFNNLSKDHKNDTVLLVSHGGTLGMLLLDIVQKPITLENYEIYKPENTAMTMLEIDEKGAHYVHFLNDTRHLN